MKRVLATGLAITALTVVAPKAANAASITIDDLTTEGSITFFVGQFEGGFVLDGTTIQSGLGSASSTVSEGTPGSPITHTFSGTWIAPGGLTPSTQTIAFQEGSTPTSLGVSDILTLTFSNTTLFGGAAGLLQGTFVSDLEGSLLPLPAGATVVPEGVPYNFFAPFLTGSAISDLDATPVPEPASLVLLGTGLGGLAVRLRRKTKLAKVC